MTNVIDIEVVRAKNSNLIFTCECGCKFFNMLDTGAECIVCQNIFSYDYIDDTLKVAKDADKKL